MPKPSLNPPTDPLPQDVRRVHEAVQYLAGVCDGAQELDGEGFSKSDAEEGHYLAEQSMLDSDELESAARMCIIYQRQLDAETLQAAKRVLVVLR